MDVEICNECGRSVKPGSGLFVNRVPDFNSPEERKEMGKPFPEGDFVCAECDAKETFTVEVAIVVRAEDEDEALEIVSNLLKPIDPHDWEITEVVNHKDL
jgi:hypothetical protein